LAVAEDGAATVSDFALTIPIFIMVTFVILQLALMANASVIIHYAAFNAARAAKTQMMDMDNAFLELDCCGVPAIATGLGIKKLIDVAASTDRDVSNKVRTAAAFPLIALAPGKKEFAPNRTPSEAYNNASIDSYLRDLAGGGDRANYLIGKAAYAFDSRYTKVDYGTPLDIRSLTGNREEFIARGAEYGAVGWELLSAIKDGPASAAARITTIPVFAEVSFRFPLLVPYAAAIFNKNDPALPSADKGIWLNARVELF
jgi:hypothetical protein